MSSYKVFKGILRDVRVNNIDLFHPQNNPNRLNRGYIEFVSRQIYKRMGYDDYHFPMYIVLGAFAAAGFTILFNKLVFGRDPELIFKQRDEVTHGEFYAFISKTNPDAKWVSFSSRLSTDKYSKMRQLPKNPEEYFTDETLKRISYKFNLDNKDFGR